MKPALLLILTILAISEPVKAYQLPKASMDADTVHLLAATIYHEDRENAVTRYTVDTIFNRVLSPYFPNTVRGVIHAPYAFEYLDVLRKKNTPIYHMSDAYARTKAYRVATLMLNDFYKGTWKPAPNMEGVVYYVNVQKLIQRNGKLPEWVNPSCAVNKRGNVHTYYTCHKNA